MRTTVLFAKDPSAMLDPVTHARKALLSASAKDYFDTAFTTDEEINKDDLFSKLQYPPAGTRRSMAVGDVIREDYNLGGSNGTLERKSFFWVCGFMGWTAI